ncbi:MAG: PASTA domain-containing protein [Massiliimalia sp.]|jgi:serine/threonine protein kinase
MSIKKCLGCMREIDENAERCPYCGFSSKDRVAAHLLAPKTPLHNRYLIGRVLYTDGEGISYLSFDVQMSRPVVIREYFPSKLVAREGQDVTVNLGCEAKFKALRSDFVDLYSHLADLKVLTNIRQVYDLFEEHNTVYAVCEYFEAQTLNEYLIDQAGELTWEQASVLFKPLLESMVVVNASGVIHRGISPEHIMVTEEGTLKLLGFSICSARSSGGLIESRLADGYAAPEQYSRMTPHGEWTDVYGLCAVLYKVLTGTQPPIATSRAVNDNLINLSELNSTVPGYVSRAVMKGLAYDYSERTRNVRDLINTLYFATRMDQTAVFSAPVVESFQEEEERPRHSEKRSKREEEYVKRDKYLVYDDDDDEEDEDIQATRYIDYGEAPRPAKSNSSQGKGKKSSKSSKGKKKKKKLPLWAIVLLLCVPLIIIICLFLYDVMIGFSPKNNHNNDSLSSLSLSESSKPESSESSEETSSESSEPEEKNAMIELRGTVYDANTIKQYSDKFNIQSPTYDYNDLPAGQICSQSVEPGTEVTPDQEITIVVSKGPKMVTVPDYTGKTPDEYISLLMSNYDVVGVKQKEYHDTIPAGDIIRVDPAVGSSLDRSAGTQVNIYVSMGPDPSQTVVTPPISEPTVPGGEDVTVPTIPTP